MTALTNYAEDALNDHILGTTALTVPTNTYVKMHLGDPGEDATGNPAAETTRKILSWAASSGGAASTDTTVSWSGLAATETWTHFSIWDALTAGNPLMYGALDSSVGVTSGGAAQIASGNLTSTAS